MITTCPPVCDSLYFSFWTRLTPELRSFIDFMRFDVSTRKKIYAKKGSFGGLDAQLCEDFQSVLGGVCRGLKGYTNTVCRIDGCGEDFCGWTMAISEPQTSVELAAQGMEIEGAPDTYHRVTIVMGSALMHGLLASGKNAFDSLYWWLCKATEFLIIDKPKLTDVRVNRIDICVDHWGCEWDIYDSEEFSRRGDCKQVGVSKRKSKNDPDSTDVHVIQSKAITIYIGRRGSAYRFLRIYNKICELEANDSKRKTDVLEDRWRFHGWNGEATVWRAEVEHGSEWLKNHGVLSAALLKNIERQLWEDYTTSVQHKKITRTRLKNCKPSKKWKKLQKAAVGCDRGEWCFQSRPQSAGNPEVLKKMGAGIVDNLADSFLNQVPLDLGGFKNLSKAERRERALGMILEELACRDGKTVEDLLNSIACAGHR